MQIVQSKYAISCQYIFVLPIRPSGKLQFILAFQLPGPDKPTPSPTNIDYNNASLASKPTALLMKRPELHCATLCSRFRKSFARNRRLMRLLCDDVRLLSSCGHGTRLCSSIVCIGEAANALLSLRRFQKCVCACESA